MCRHAWTRIYFNGNIKQSSFPSLHLKSLGKRAIFLINMSAMIRGLGCSHKLAVGRHRPGALTGTDDRFLLTTANSSCFYPLSHNTLLGSADRTGVTAMTNDLTEKALERDSTANGHDLSSRHRAMARNTGTKESRKHKNKAPKSRKNCKQVRTKFRSSQRLIHLLLPRPREKDTTIAHFTGRETDAYKD